MFAGNLKRVYTGSDKSTLSLRHLDQILQNLKHNQHCDATSKVYHGIWVKFNKFIIHLDEKPKTWEYSATLYGLYLAKEGIKSSTLRSYISAIKHKLVADDYDWDDRKMLLSTLTRTCKMINDQIFHRFPIQIRLLELILCKLEEKFDSQPYLEIMYKTLFIVLYYSLMRVGELTMGRHTLKAVDVHAGNNKNKLLLVLHSSKTHGRESRPQLIKILKTKPDNRLSFNFCPFTLTNKYMTYRGGYIHEDDAFIVMPDNSPVYPAQVRKVLRDILKDLSLNPALYDTHSFRIGRATDLLKATHSLEYIKRIGHWKSNAVYRYLRDI